MKLDLDPANHLNPGFAYRGICTFCSLPASLQGQLFAGYHQSLHAASSKLAIKLDIWHSSFAAGNGIAQPEIRHS